MYSFATLQLNIHGKAEKVHRVPKELCYNNTTSHIFSYQFALVDYPSYSLDLVPSGNFMFDNIKKKPKKQTNITNKNTWLESSVTRCYSITLS